MQFVSHWATGVKVVRMCVCVCVGVLGRVVTEVERNCHKYF